ncbi:MAG: FAD-binding oxidoreductase [Gemmatimonadales bacterium]
MPPPELRTDLATRYRYSQGAGIYRMIPAAVGRPGSVGELRALMAMSRERELTITPRGAGSAMPGDNVSGGLLLDLTALDQGRCEIDPSRRQARVTPSLALAELNGAASPHGLRFPVDPSSAAWATLGGMVSTNAAGTHSLRTGCVRRCIQRLVLETLDGPLELIRGAEPPSDHPVIARWQATGEPLLRLHAATIAARFPRTRKNSAGYALDRYLEHGELLDIVVGSEGTLGVITDLTVELEPIPAFRASLRVSVRRRADLPRTIEALCACDPATLELLDQTFLQLIAGSAQLSEGIGLDGGAAGLLLADFEDDDPALVRERVAMAVRAVRDTALDVASATTDGEIDRLWAIRHGASPILAGLSDGRRSLQVIEDGCVPVARLADYLDAVDASARSARMDAVMFGHAGDGHVHVNLLPNLNDIDWEERVRAVFDAVSEAVIRLGGTPSGEHGVGRLRAALLLRCYGQDVMTCFHAVKSVFDPAGRFNPGVILSDGSDPLSHLKVGAAAVPIPRETERYLSGVESSASWASSRWSVSQ